MIKQIRGTVNYVEVIGWVGDNPEQRSLSSGTTMCMFRVATKRLGARTTTGERTYETDWLAVEAWDRLAALCIRSLHKGSRLRLVGSLHTQSWEDKETGQRRYKTVIRAEEVMFLDTKGGSSSGANDAEEGDGAEESEDIPY